MSKLLLDRLRDVGCDREPFTAAHKDCICRLTNEGAREIERLTSVMADYEDVLRNHRALVRRLDVALNGDGAAKQASLVDLVAQFERT